ncbi:MAG TPA: magnesium transporter [Devosia sp.]|nr:magnesium transporter [Devosia sp.]
MTYQSETAAEIAELSRLNSADAVEILNRESPQEAARRIGELPFALAVRILERSELSEAPAIITAMPDTLAGRLLDAMADDRATDIVGALEPEVSARLIKLVGAASRSSIETLLAYPAGTAGAMMTTEYVAVPATFTVGATLAYVRKVERTRETIYAIYVLDPGNGHLLRVVTLRRLIMGDAEAPILSIASEAAPIVVGPLMPREDVARLIRRHDLLALPVVDEAQRMLGIVTVDDVIDAMIAEQTEDVHKFGGLEALDRPYMQISFLGMIRKRAGWLCALFLSEMLTASAMQTFADELNRAVVLTLFIPLIMSSGGNSGSQATSLLIRSLALNEIGLREWWRVALRELPTGLVLGAILGVIGVIRISAWQWLGLFNYGAYWPLIATTVGASLVGIVTFGSLAGSMLPFALKALKFDPASASAPFVATLVDVTGLVIYFSIALVFLRGTLL